MATSFIDTYFTEDEIRLTSMTTDIKASTDKNKISVALSCENGSDGDPETFYSTTLYAFKGIVELFDVGSIVAEYFRLRGKIADVITVQLDNISMDIHFLYCEYLLPDSFDAENSLLVASSAQRVRHDSIITIAAFNHGQEFSATIKAVGPRQLDGSVGMVSKEVAMPFTDGYTAYFHVPDIVKWAINNTEDELGDDALARVMYFSIEYAGAQKMCYLAPAPAYLTFSFRNIFNVREYVDVVGVMTTKTEVSRNMAVCGGRTRQYDRNLTRSYEVVTEALTADEIPLFEQFVASHEITLSVDGQDWPVIITDHTCEPSTSDETLTAVKFSWRFSDRPPRLFASDFNGIMPARQGIFNDKFTPEYE